MASPHLTRLINLALEEDLGPGDWTAQTLFSPNASGRAQLEAREPLVVAGLDVACQVFERLDPRVRFAKAAKEGQRLARGSVLLQVQGRLQALMSAERIALNFVRHLSGVATLTRRCADTLAGTRTRLLDTRKTTPGFRALEKAAVRAGGGHNHRLGLFDGVMIKDNHIAATGSIRKAVSRARDQIPPTLKIEVECETLSQVREALAANADLIMLDNMSLADMRKAVALIDGRALTEASGRVTIDRLEAIAACGVDFVSMGALTHSAPQVDIAMEMIK